MRLSISNIGWRMEDDENIYDLMGKYGFTGLEIAPSRVFSSYPYARLKEAEEWAGNIKKKYGFFISSMQSIWYGRKERLFVTDDERKVLLDYTKQAVDFASVIGCRNLVFGCPGSRRLPDGNNGRDAVCFFREIGNYAMKHSAVIGMEANPLIYNTNYINRTSEALELIADTGSEGFRLNLDVGAMIANDESADMIKGKICLVSHVHISEPGLKAIEKRDFHEKLAGILQEEGYDGFVSIERKCSEDISSIENNMKYIKEIFG